MSLVVTDIGAVELLARALRGEAGDFHPWSLALFANDYTPHKASVWTDFIQPTWAGYFRQDIDPAAWTDPVTVSGRASSTNGTVPFEWTNGGPQTTVYGYWILNLDTFSVVWAERANTPRVIDSGGKLRVLLRATGVSEFS